MYYIDENNKLYEKTGIDFRVERGLQTLDGLTVATDEQVDAILNPEKTQAELFAEELSLLNSEYESDINGLNLSMANVILVDGDNETAKKTALQERFTERKAQYDSDKLTLMANYGLV